MLVIELNHLMLAVGGLEKQIRIIDDGCGAGRRKGRRSCFDGSRLRPRGDFCGGHRNSWLAAVGGWPDPPRVADPPLRGPLGNPVRIDAIRRPAPTIARHLPGELNERRHRVLPSPPEFTTRFLLAFVLTATNVVAQDASAF